MVIVVTLKNLEWKHRYENVRKFEVKPKEDLHPAVDLASIEEMDCKYVFIMYFEDGETATFSVNKDFEYKVLSYA